AAPTAIPATPATAALTTTTPAPNVSKTTRTPAAKSALRPPFFVVPLPLPFMLDYLSFPLQLLLPATASCPVGAPCVARVIDHSMRAVGVNDLKGLSKASHILVPALWRATASEPSDQIRMN